MNQKENQVTKGDGKTGFGGADIDGVDNVVQEFDAEFRPIEHPLEPLDEDQPVKWPIQDCPLLNVIWKETVTENRGKRADILVESEGSTAEQPPARAVRKRCHTLRDHGVPQSVKSHQSNIFQIFQQCKDFSS